MDVRYDHVSKSFAGVEALIELDLDVSNRTFLALLGPFALVVQRHFVRGLTLGAVK